MVLLFRIIIYFVFEFIYFQAADCPRELATTRQILSLMSLGQFLPHPLNSVPNVLSIFHAFHVHCVLQDIWNFMRDNVPSPVAFASNRDEVLVREFDDYKTYKSYCERLRLIMIRHIAEIPEEFKKFFVDGALKQEQNMKIAMEY